MLRLLDVMNRHANALQTMWLATLKTSVAATRLGWIWWLVDPLILMAIFYFLVHIILQRGGDTYHVFVLVGLVVWQFFNRALYLTADCLRSNRGLIKSMPLPLEFYTLLPALVQMVFVFCGVVMVLFFVPGTPGVTVLAVLPLVFLTAGLAWSVGLALCVWQVVIPDMSKLLHYVLRAGFFLSPVLYDVDRLQHAPEWVQRLYACNPMAWILPAMRKVLLHGELFDLKGFVFWLAVVLLVGQFGLWQLRSRSSLVVKCL